MSNLVFIEEFEKTNNYNSNKDGKNNENLNDKLDFEVIIKFSASFNI